MKLEFLDKAKKKRLFEKLNYLAELKTSLLFVQSGKERINVFSGSLALEEIWKVWRLFNIEGIGMYFGKQLIDRNREKEVRLSLDALHLFKENIKKIVALDKEQTGQWMEGKDIQLNEKQKEHLGFVAVSDGEDFIGTGKSNGEILFNYLPKERRVKN